MNLLFKFWVSALLILFTLLSESASASTETASFDSLIDEGLQSYAQGHYSEAIGYYQKALHQPGGQSAAYDGEGLVLMKLGLWARAEEVFQKALAVDPSNPKLWLGLGWAQQKRGHRLDAIASFQKVFQFNSTRTDQTIAAKHLAQMGADVPAGSVVQAPQANSFDASLKPKLTVHAGGGFNDNLNEAPVNAFNFQAAGPLNDNLADLGASLGLDAPLTPESLFHFDAVYDNKIYFSDTAFDSQDVTGSVVYERQLFSWLRGQGGLSGEYFGQSQGINYYSGSGSVGFWGRGSSFRLSGVYTFSLEQYANYNLPFNPVLPLLGDPSNSDSKVEVRAHETLLPWLVLNGEYQFKSNNADSLGYQYTLNGVGGGAEVFLFSGPNLISALQLNYLHTASVCPSSMLFLYQGGLISTNQQGNQDIFSAHLNIPIETRWSVDAFYRYVNNQSNYGFLSYVDHAAGFNLSYELL